MGKSSSYIESRKKVVDPPRLHLKNGTDTGCTVDNLRLNEHSYRIIKVFCTFIFSLIAAVALTQTYNGAGNPQPMPPTGSGGPGCAGGPTTSVASLDPILPPLIPIIHCNASSIPIYK